MASRGTEIGLKELDIGWNVLCEGKGAVCHPHVDGFGLVTDPDGCHFFIRDDFGAQRSVRCDQWCPGGFVLLYDSGFFFELGRFGTISF